MLLGAPLLGPQDQEPHDDENEDERKENPDRAVGIEETAAG
jgi:hypothetical protein